MPDAIQPDLAGHVLILSGPPGAGKSTCAHALARLPGTPAVHLHADDFWSFVGTGRLLPIDPAAHALNAVVIEAVAGAAEGFARGGLLAIVDCCLDPRRLGPFLAMGRPLHYVVLRIDAPTAIERCRARGGDSLADPGPIADLNAQFADLGAHEGHAIDVRGLAPGEVQGAVLAALRGGAFRLARST